ncbi:beta-aspartyl-peptidase [Aeromonas hydrophila]|uniref:beta-aspartyl-peptidase n=1 Tax=Aeromonas hydrophila TaxID=644 RepID=UPI0019161EF2|nr:beta-aspartyl-peptidase [Aeromonas hydrophila]MBQ4676345.1 beta-aspartyl-peptidase [Aeromonas hydrophila]MBW3812950.1 beta-aspartyl-peptidase [Aeromonas hydrophila]MCF7678183.1 beta-aspartyl-peptidase [Aeromonas hydrophila]MCF7691231.1 beta-aspartyl-peptidase [Aeromonas hydrophila]MCF7773961.1 beta-aspartyl-peptidase [Aeromonas hydrophila]
MLTLIEGAELYGPIALGRQDLLVADGRIAWMGRGLSVPADWPLARVDGRGRYLVPGLVDPLAHITGGGGEGGFGFRTPELAAREALKAGVTTLVAALGTDSLTRSPAQVLGKVREFRAAGVSAFMYSGSYHLPVKTLTGSVESDIMLIPEVLGVGEVAISDHRSSAPTHDELARLVSEARVAGLLAGKSGVSFFHLGDGRGALAPLRALRDGTDIPLRQLYPTHCNRNPWLFAEVIEWGRAGGWVDLTTSSFPDLLDDGERLAADALVELLAAGVPADRISFSSDANASLPRFDSEGRLIELRCGQIDSLWQALVESCDKGVALEVALAVVTANPARALGLATKGTLAVGQDADLLLIDPATLTIERVMSGGRWRT